MKKTGSQLEQDFYDILKAGVLPGLISGDIYKNGLRPLDSKKEDALIMFVSGLDGQVQTGFVIVNVFVPDILSNGHLYRNVKRCRELEEQLNDIVTNLNSNLYDISLSGMIQTFPEPDIEQHFVSAKIKFKLFTN